MTTTFDTLYEDLDGLTCSSCGEDIDLFDAALHDDEWLCSTCEVKKFRAVPATL